MTLLVHIVNVVKNSSSKRIDLNLKSKLSLNIMGTNTMHSSRDFAVKTRLLRRLAARLPKYLNYMREDHKWIFMFIFSRAILARKLERLYRNATHRPVEPVVTPHFENIDPNKIVDILIARGAAEGLILKKELLEQIVDFSENNLCYAKDMQDFGFHPNNIQAANKRRGRDILTAYYFESVEKCPAITRLVQDQLLISIARGYIGSNPVHIRTRMWWSFAAKSASDEELHDAAQEKYHFDMNGWRTLKFFFYLTKTDRNNGAHRYIAASHKNRPLRFQIRATVGVDLVKLQRYYNKANFCIIEGDSGVGFVEDPFIFHTGSLCKDGRRLILEIEYASSPVSPSYKYGRLG